jgi:hypothetical protein
VLPTTRLGISVSPMCSTAAMRPSRTVKQSISFARSPASSTSTTATTRSRRRSTRAGGQPVRRSRPPGRTRQRRLRPDACRSAASFPAGSGPRRQRRRRAPASSSLLRRGTRSSAIKRRNSTTQSGTKAGDRGPPRRVLPPPARRPTRSSGRRSRVRGSGAKTTRSPLQPVKSAAVRVEARMKTRLHDGCDRPVGESARDDLRVGWTRSRASDRGAPRKIGEFLASSWRVAGIGWLWRAKFGSIAAVYGTEGHRFESCRARSELPSKAPRFQRGGGAIAPLCVAQ